MFKKIINKLSNILKMRDKQVLEICIDYNDALKKSGCSYYNDEVATVVVEKNINYSTYLKNKKYVVLDSSAKLLLISVLSTEKKKIKVIDFGGGGGASYFLMKKCLPSDIKLSWFVIETPEIVKKSEILKTDELSFSTDLESVLKSCELVDLVICSGVIQYLSEPYNFLRTLVVNTKVNFILFSRMSFSLEEEDIFSVQKTFLSAHGPGKMPENFRDTIIKIPHTNIRYDMFEKIMEERYERVYTFQDESGILNVKDKSIVGLGILYKKII